VAACWRGAHYLVQTTENAFDNGEKRVNIDKSNMVWFGSSDNARISRINAKTASLWGDTTEGSLHGSMLKLPAAFKGKIRTNANQFRVRVIRGTLSYQHNKETKELEPGSYFGSRGDFAHPMYIKNGQESMLYIRSNGRYEVLSE
tara:strand:- start:499110 stop:499544 length:435 start_codon:yes stop_codon:yes gene_type:complete